jgi:hypothetical protein
MADIVDVVKLISEALTAPMIASLLVEVHVVDRKGLPVVICVRAVCFLIERGVPRSRRPLRLGDDDRNLIVRARGLDPPA